MVFAVKMRGRFQIEDELDRVVNDKTATLEDVVSVFAKLMLEIACDCRSNIHAVYKGVNEVRNVLNGNGSEISDEIQEE